MKSIVPVCAVLLALIGSSSGAATYYVDAEKGDDLWSGRANAPSGTDGPWRTLARVGAASLLPGDNVLLKCGQVWYEPLAIRASGTPSSPITIGAFPAGCAERPTIDGALPIPAHAWTHHGAGIYRATLPPGLIANGSFDADLAGWRIYSPRGDAVMTCARARTAS